MIGLVAGNARRSSKLLPRGWDSVEIVVRDVDGLADRLVSRPGCVAVAEPFTTDLSHLGGNVHRSGVWRMPWGTHLIATAGLTQPKTRRFPEAIGEAGPVFEVHLRTDRFEAARSLYADALGMQVFMDSTFYEGPIHSAWGVPAGRRIEMQLLKGQFAGTGEGAIELQGHETAVLAAAPRADGGTSVVTYGVDGLEELCETLRERQFTLLASPCELKHGPFAPRRSAVVRGVEGERMQLVER